MKNLVKLLGLIALVGAPCFAQSLNNDSAGVKEKYISAFGEAKMARAVASSVCSFKDTVLTAAEIGALNATPIELVPAPGAGKTLIPCYAVTWLNYGGTVWAGSSQNILIKYGTAGAQPINTITEAYMERTADSFGYWSAISGHFPVENTALYATADADFTTGNSPLSIRVYYQTIGASLIQE